MGEHGSRWQRKSWRQLSVAALLLSVVLIALATYLFAPLFSTAEYAVLTIKSQDITEDNEIQIAVAQKTTRGNGVSLTCPFPTIAAAPERWSIPWMPERRMYYYVWSPSPELAGVDPRQLSAGFLYEVDDTIRLDNQTGELPLFAISIDGNEHQMTVALNRR